MRYHTYGSPRSRQVEGGHRTCVLCVGIQEAVAALAKGSASPTLGALLLSLFWSVAARGATLWRIEYAIAKANDDDATAYFRLRGRLRLSFRRFALRLAMAYRHGVTPPRSHGVQKREDKFTSIIILRLRFAERLNRLLILRGIPIFA